MLRAQQQRNRTILAEGTSSVCKSRFILSVFLSLLIFTLSAAKENGRMMPSNLLPSCVCLNSVRLFWQQVRPYLTIELILMA